LASRATTTHSSGALVQRYATALYGYAEEEHALDATVEQMEALGRLIDESVELRALLGSPLVDVNTATRALRQVLEEQGFAKVVLNFASVVAANRRLGALRGIVAAFAGLVAEKRGVVVAHVESAHPLSDVQVQQLRARLIEAGYGNVDIVRRVDPSLLGGLIVRIGARLYDTSLRSRLQRLQYAMKGAA
jgi:F-type H+-transporting ATPase subunit delta